MSKQLAAKVYLHEIKTVSRYWSFGEEVKSVKYERYLFVTPEKLGHNVSRILYSLEVYEDTYHWNYMGDEYKVDPDYARSCQLYSNFADCVGLSTLLSVYGMQVSIPEHSGVPIKDRLNWEDWHGEGQARTKKYQKLFEGWLEKLEGKIFSMLPSHGFTIRIDSYPSYTEHTLKVINLATDFLHAPGVVLDEHSGERAAREYEAYYNSEQYEIDRQEEIERRNEIATYMGENGFSSFATNEDGSVSFW